MALVTGTNFLMMLSVVLASLDVATARYAMVLEKAGNCEPNSKIVMNYTYTRATNQGVGQVEYLEKIEPNSNIQLSITVHYKSVQGGSELANNNYYSMNSSKTDLCLFLHTDMLYLPYVREYVSVEKYCPVNKGIKTFRKSTIFLKRMTRVPLGCWKIRVRMEKDGKPFSCIYLDLQLLPSLDAERIKCG